MKIRKTEKPLENGRVWEQYWGAASEDNGTAVHQREVSPGCYALPVKWASLTLFKDGRLVLEVAVPLLKKLGNATYITVGKTQLAPERALALLGPEVVEEMLTIPRGTRVSLAGDGEIGWVWDERKEGGELYFSRVALTQPASLRNYAQVGGLFAEETLHDRSSDKAVALIGRLANAASSPKAPAPLPTLAPLARQAPDTLPVAEAPTPAALLDNV